MVFALRKAPPPPFFLMAGQLRGKEGGGGKWPAIKIIYFFASAGKKRDILFKMTHRNIHIQVNTLNFVSGH